MTELTWLECDIEIEDYENDMCIVFIDLAKWDEWTPEQRFEYILGQINNELGEGVMETFSLNGNDGFSYEVGREIDLTVTDMRKHRMLVAQDAGQW